MASNSIKLLTGNSHPQLAKLVADRYDGSFQWQSMIDKVGQIGH